MSIREDVSQFCQKVSVNVVFTGQVQMIPLFREHVGFWTKERKKSLRVGILFLIVALFIQFVAHQYSEKSATSFVGDLFLDNLPVVDFSYIIVNGAFLAIIIGLFLIILKPRYLVFSLKVVSFFIVTRAFFVTLTHIGIYPSQITLGDSPIDQFYMFLNLQDGFFFSGHTGMPFLGALIFWNEKFWRYFFIAVSILFGTAALFAHVHYSIDVFAAPFMTYAIFKFAELELFKKDYATMRE